MMRKKSKKTPGRGKDFFNGGVSKKGQKSQTGARERFSERGGQD